MRIVIPAAVALIVAGCGGNAHPTAPDARRGLTPVTATAEWPASSPGAERVDESRMEQVVTRIRGGEYGRMSSLLVARNGRLIVEEYFDGMVPERAHTQQSVTKSVTSLLVGIAARSGRVAPGDPVTRFFPEYEPIANVDERKRAVTVADLLAMRSGFDWDESTYAGSPLERMNQCGCDWLRFVLDWRMREMPGTRFEYISGGTILAGGIVGAATGSRLDQFAALELFGPLGITGTSWAQGRPDGLPHAGGGLYMRPRDMLKIGTLVLDEGRWGSQQVVDPAWVRLTTTRVSRGVRTWVGRTVDYGYGWWLFDYNGNTVITASGALGQWIFVVPSMRLVMSATANDPNRGLGAVEVLFSTVLPATAMP